MNAIEINNLTKSYGKFRGINNVSVEVNCGEIFGFIGPNGAGKSTTIKILLNFLFPTSGKANILGMDIVKHSNLIKENIGYVPSDVRYYGDVKVKDIIKYSESFFNNIDKDYTNAICRELDIEMHKKIRELSLGNKKKVAIVQALIGNPKILILDEPTIGLDPLVQKKLFNILLREKEKGTTIFLSSHNLVEVENLCDKVAIIKDGEIIDILDLKKNYRNLGKKITLKSKDATEEKINKLCSKILEHKEDEFIFIYDKDINDLISILSTWNIKKLLIEDIKLQESFLDYYKGKED